MADVARVTLALPKALWEEVRKKIGEICVICG